MDAEFTTHRCSMCDGPFHPATGCSYSPTFTVCRDCTVRFWEWARQHTNAKGRRRGANFYDHVNVIARPIVVVDVVMHSTYDFRVR